MNDFFGFGISSETFSSKCFSILISDYEISEIDLPETVESHKKYFEEYKIFDKHFIKDFIKNNYDKDVLNAFDTLNGNAYKADLASYCILNKIGGWHSAITNTILMPPPQYFYHKDMIIFRDIQKNSNSSWAITCHPIYSKPNNKVFDIAIEIILKNVKENNYGYSPLCISGPCVLGQAVAILGHDQSYSIGNFVDGDEKYFFLEDGNIFAKYKIYEGGVMNIKGTNNYNNFWFDKNVYGEKNV